MNLELFEIGFILVKAFVMTLSVFSAFLIISNPKKYFFCEGDRK